MIFRYWIYLSWSEKVYLIRWFFVFVSSASSILRSILKGGIHHHILLSLVVHFLLTSIYKLILRSLVINILPRVRIKLRCHSLSSYCFKLTRVVQGGLELFRWLLMRQRLHVWLLSKAHISISTERWELAGILTLVTKFLKLTKRALTEATLMIKCWNWKKLLLNTFLGLHCI